MSEEPSKETVAINEALSGSEPSLEKDTEAVAAEPTVKVVADDDEGEESDTYDDFENDQQEDDAGDDDDDYEDEEEAEAGGQNGAPVNKASLTALLLGNPNAPDADNEDDDDEDGDSVGYVEEDDESFNHGQADDAQSAPGLSTTNGKKRSIDAVHELDGDAEAVETKKAKA